MIEVTALKPIDREYPKELETIGEHLRARRMELGLLQKDVAKMFDVTVSCVENWERHRHPPTTRNRYKIIEFLDADSSIKLPEIELGIKLKEHRSNLGLTQKSLAIEIGIGVNTLMQLENGEHRILEKTQEKVRLYLLEMAKLNSQDVSL